MELNTLVYIFLALTFCFILTNDTQENLNPLYADYDVLE